MISAKKKLTLYKGHTKYLPGILVVERIIDPQGAIFGVCLFVTLTFDGKRLYVIIRG